MNGGQFTLAVFSATILGLSWLFPPFLGMLSAFWLGGIAGLCLAEAFPSECLSHSKGGEDHTTALFTAAQEARLREIARDVALDLQRKPIPDGPTEHRTHGGDSAIDDPIPEDRR